MATKEYAFYPGCSSQKGASASNYLTSVESMCKTLDVKLTEIPDWKCCGASIGYAEAGELPRHVLNARNFALSEKNLPGQEIVATCAACWLGARESKERLDHTSQLMQETNEALAAAGLKYEGKVKSGPIMTISGARFYENATRCKQREIKWNEPGLQSGSFHFLIGGEEENSTLTPPAESCWTLSLRQINEHSTFFMSLF